MDVLRFDRRGICMPNASGSSPGGSDLRSADEARPDTRCDDFGFPVIQSTGFLCCRLRRHLTRNFITDIQSMSGTSQATVDIK